MQDSRPLNSRMPSAPQEEILGSTGHHLHPQPLPEGFTAGRANERDLCNPSSPVSTHLPLLEDIPRRNRQATPFLLSSSSPGKPFKGSTPACTHTHSFLLVIIMTEDRLTVFAHWFLWLDDQLFLVFRLLQHCHHHPSWRALHQPSGTHL